MRFIKKKIYEGKNIFSNKGVIAIDIDFEGDSETFVKDTLDLKANLISVVSQIKKTKEDIELKRIFSLNIKDLYIYLINELEIRFNLKNNFQIKKINKEIYSIIIEYEYKNTNLYILGFSLDLINSLMKNEEVNIENMLEEIEDLKLKETMEPSVKAIIDKAIEKNMPVIKLGENDFYQVGYGKSGRIFNGVLGEKTNGVLLKLSYDRLLSNEILKKHYIPVVNRKKIKNVNEILKLANEIGYPVVLKNQYKSEKNFIVNNIKDEEGLLKYYELLSKEYDDLILEKHIEGKKIKVCVIDYKVVGVSLKTQSSIGGISEDYTEILSYENKEICEKVAKLLSLDTCGIDIITEDISTSLNEIGAIIDVTSNPNIIIYECPHIGEKRMISDAILNMAYDNYIKNIPVISILEKSNKDMIVKGVNYILSRMGYVVGAKTKDQLIINNKYIVGKHCEKIIDSKSILLNKEVDISILSSSKEEVMSRGLDYELCDVAIIEEYNSINKDFDAIDNLVINSIKDDGYLIIDVDEYSDFNKLNKIKSKKIFFSFDAENEILKENIEKGDPVVYIDNEIIYVENNKKKYMICKLKDIPIMSMCIDETKVKNIISICAGLVGLKVDYCMISKGLKSFENKLN